MISVALVIDPHVRADRMRWVALHVFSGYQVDLVFSGAKWARFALERLGQLPPHVAVSREQNVLHIMPVAPRAPRRKGRS